MTDLAVIGKVTAGAEEEIIGLRVLHEIDGAEGEQSVTSLLPGFLHVVAIILLVYQMTSIDLLPRGA